MAEDVKPADDKKPEAAKIVSAGQPVAMQVTRNNPAPGSDVIPTGKNLNKPDDNSNGATKGAAPVVADNKGAADNKGGATTKDAKADPPADDKKGDPAKPVEIPEDQLKAYFESIGVKYEGVEALKSKLNAPAPAAELTPEQKEQASKERESRLADRHIKSGKSLDQLTAMRTIIAAKPIELGLEIEVNDLVKTYGVSKEKAAELAKDRYFQYTDEEIEAIQDKEDKEDAIKRREIGTKKLERKGAYNQKNAQGYLDTLSKGIDDEDAEKIHAKQHAEKLEAAVKAYQRKQPLKIGQIDENLTVDDVDFAVGETAMAQAKELLGDRGKFDNNLLTTDDHLNLDFLLPHIIRSLTFDDAVKEAYKAGNQRAVDFVKGKFGSDIPPLGGEKKETGTPGKVVTAGKPEVFRPVRQ